MSKNKPATTRTSFFDHLKQALETFDDPNWLGMNSPLAAPYFLGDAVRRADATPAARGQILRGEIERVLETMWGGPLPEDGHALLAAAEDNQSGRYDCLILELNYFKQRVRPAPRSQADIYNDILHISRPTHDRHLRAAVERLGTLLLRRLRPTVRPEQPALPVQLVGRDDVQAQATAALADGKTISLTGPGGMGKTSLAAVLADAWPSPAIFWYTFRPTLNDQLDSLLFALGHFLHRQGASTLWHQLVADGGRLKDASIAVGLARGDLAGLPHKPLLCFDELDFLRPLTTDEARPNHTQLLEFIDSLRGHSAMILIGQRAFWESDLHFGLDGLDDVQLRRLLTALSVPHTAEDAAALHLFTAGNPRMVELCIALFQAGSGESFGDVLAQLPQFQALLPLWLRLERRLPEPERRLLQILSVFRASAPADVWRNGEADAATALARLIERRLVQEDGQGGVSLLPALSEIVFAELPAESQEDLHLYAAQIRQERGEYTSAAHHLFKAGQLDEAVALWYTHREDEIHRGQAATALALFEQISLRRLSRPRQKELRLLRGELYQIRGAPEMVIESLANAEWEADDAGSVDAALLLGRAYDHQGQGERAMESFASGLAVAHKLLGRMVDLQVQRGMLHLHERNMQEAWQEAQRARYLTENLTGILHEQSGRLDEAHTHFASALAISQEIGYLPGVARSFHNLGNVASRRKQLDQAIDYYAQSMTIYEQMGDRVGLEVARSGIVAPYMQAQRYAEAIGEARRALTFFQAMGYPFWVALNASNLAESYFEAGSLADAESYAQLVLGEEEPQSHPYALFTLGRVRAAQGNLADARYILDQARGLAELNEDRYLLAYCLEEMGKVQRSSQLTSEAAASFAQAAELFQMLKINDKAGELALLAAQLDTKG